VMVKPTLQGWWLGGKGCLGIAGDHFAAHRRQASPHRCSTTFESDAVLVGAGMPAMGCKAAPAILQLNGTLQANQLSFRSLTMPSARFTLLTASLV
ncbi:hypothetical protein COK82_31905, partial [Bacillus thuringiensis]